MKTTKPDATLVRAHTQSSKAKTLVSNTVKTVAKQSSLKKKEKETTERIESTKEADAGIHLTQILNYYRGRVEAFEKDRTQWYKKLEDIRIKQDQVHKVEWELKKRQEEKLEIDRAINQCQNALYQERERIVKLKEAVDQTRVKGKENRQLILQLLEANNAVE